MAVQPIVNAAFLANPTVDGHPARYSAADVATAFGALNRTTSHVFRCIPWEGIQGNTVFARQHDSAINGRDAEFYLDNGVTAITAQTEYRVSNQASLSAPVAQFVIKCIMFRVDVRDSADAMLSEFYRQKAFQKEAGAFAVSNVWEQGAAIGDAGTNPEEFEGLDRLSLLFGQTFAAANRAFNPLSDINDACTRVKAHGGRVDLIVMNLDAFRKVVDIMRGLLNIEPDFRYNAETGLTMLHYNGIPICINDHIPTTGVDPDRLTDIYVMTLGKPNGVYGIVNANAPGIQFYETHREDSPFVSVQGQFWSAIVSSSSDALVKINDWNVSLT